MERRTSIYLYESSASRQSQGYARWREPPTNAKECVRTVKKYHEPVGQRLSRAEVAMTQSDTRRTYAQSERAFSAECSAGAATDWFGYARSIEK